MAFRNPLRSLPASAITGQITGAQLAPGAVDGTTITGSVVKTGASGNRVVMQATTRNGQSVGEIDFYTEVSTDSPGQITAYGPADGTLRALEGIAPDSVGGPPAPWWKLSYEDTGAATRFDVSADTTYVNKLKALSMITTGDVSVGGSASVSGSLAVTGPHQYVSGAVIKSDATGTVGEVWQTPGYTANWSDSTSFNGSTGYAPLRYRKDAQDNVYVAGAFKAGATVPANPVFALPVGYRPLTGVWPLFVQRNNGGTLTTGHVYVNTNGNFDLFASAGMGIAAGNEYVVTGSFPIGNIA